MYFRGDVIAEQTIIGVYNHGTIDIKGNIEAELIISDDHAFNIYSDQIKKGIQLGFGGLYSLKDALKSEFYDSYEECIKSKAVLKALRKGVSLKREGQIETPLQKRITKFGMSKKGLLDLSEMNLKEIPQQVFELEDILELDLSANYISQLPKELLRLKKLRKIGLYNCEFTEFPTLLLEVPTIEEIDLGKNQINSLPSGVARLNQLKKLELHNCSFDEFPQEIYFLPKLEALDLSYQENQPAFVIDKAMAKLKVLNMYANFGVQITTAQPALEKLNMRNCSLKEIPLVLTQSLKLKSLDVTLNNIKTFPKEICHLKKLTHLSFGLCNIDSASIELLQNFPKLSTLTIEFQHKKEPRNITGLLQLEQWTTLYFEGYLEDQFVVRDILKRPNLKKIVSIDGYGNEEEFDIKEGRAMLGINI